MIESNFIQQILFWMFVPSLVTYWIQKCYYSLCHRGPVPANSDPRYKKHYRIIFTLFISCYLAYSLYEMEQQLAPNYYNLLNVTLNSPEKKIKMSYRTLSLQYHPDKIDPSEAEKGEEMYIHIRKAYDALRESKMRMLYDKYGTSIHDCPRCTKERDYFWNIIYDVAGFNLGTTCVMFLMGVLYKSGGLYWRLVSQLLIGSLELLLLVSNGGGFMTWVLPWRCTFEKITLLRQSHILVSIAISQLSPIFFPKDSDGTGGVQKSLETLENLIAMQTSQSQASLTAAFEPFSTEGEEKAAGLLQRRMEKLAIEGHLADVDPAYMKEVANVKSRVLKRK